MTQLIGHEMLGAAAYKQFAIQNLPSGRCGKTFGRSVFGDSMPVQIGWAKKGVHPILSLQATWAGQSHDYSSAKFLKEAISEAKRYNEIAKDFPHIQFEFSPYCEHNLSPTRMLHDIQEIIPYASHLKIFNSPNLNGILLTGFPDEVHGKYNPKGLRPPYDWACDGMSAYDADIAYWLNEHIDADIIWGWIPQYNRKKNTTDDTAIQDRRVLPVAKQVISLDYILTNPKGICDLQKDAIWKSHADQHFNQPAAREQKPVLITKVSGNEANLIAANGKKVYTLQRKGNYTDGRPLYRGPDRGSLWGFEISERAKRMSGSPVVKVVINGQNLGKVNPAFRQNLYRVE